MDSASFQSAGVGDEFHAIARKRNSLWLSIETLSMTRASTSSSNQPTTAQESTALSTASRLLPLSSAFLGGDNVEHDYEYQKLEDEKVVTEADSRWRRWMKSGAATQVALVLLLITGLSIHYRSDGGLLGAEVTTKGLAESSSIFAFGLDFIVDYGNILGAAVLLAVCAGLCISAGSGGGGLYVPLIIALLGKPVHTATSMSQILIFGAAMAGVAYDLFQRHPERQRPLVDLSVILYLAPLMMAGALVGSTISATLPPSLVMLALVFACSAAAYKSLRKGFRLWKTEQQMDLDVMDTMEPMDPISILTCRNFENLGDLTPKGSRKKKPFQHPPELVLENPFPAHDHVVPLKVGQEEIKSIGRLGQAGSIDEQLLKIGNNLIPSTDTSGEHTPSSAGTEEREMAATDMIYYKKLRDLKKGKSKRPYEVMGMHRISFWNPKCNCVFSTFRDQDFVMVFQFLSRKELFSCRAVCLRWHFLSHAKELHPRFGNLKRTVSYSVIWNPETPEQLPMVCANPPLARIKEEPLMLGPSHATEIQEESETNDVSETNNGNSDSTFPADLMCQPCTADNKSSNGKSKTKTFRSYHESTPLIGSRNGMFGASYGVAKLKSKLEPSRPVFPASGAKSELDTALKVMPPLEGNKQCLLRKQQRMITEAREKSREIIVKEQTISPTQTLKLLAIWIITFALIVVRGGKGTKSILNVEYCGPVYWGVTGASIVLLLGVAYVASSDLFHMHKLKIACHYPFAKGDPHWNTSYLQRMAVITFCTGIAAGVLGVGGGMFLSPVLFEMGMLPMVVAAISTACILLSSSVLTVLIIVQGTVAVSEVVFLFFGTVIGAFVGKFFVRRIVKRFRSSAIIPIILGGVIIASMLVATQQNAMKFVRQLESGSIEGFKGVCAAR